MKRFLLLLCLFLGALFLRLSPGTHTVIFPYDQARDALYAQQIIETKDPPLLGPVSDIPGVHHGALFYWIIAPLYALGHYDPSVVVAAFALISSLGVFSYFYVIRKLLDERTAWIASILYAASFLSVSFSRWISNPVFIIPLMPLVVLCLYQALFERRRFAWLGLIFGVLVQFELVLGYLLFLVLAAGWRAKNRLKAYLQLGVGFFLGALPLFVAELKFHFQGVRGLMGFVAGHSTATSVKTGNVILDMINVYSTILRDTLVGLNAPLALAAVILLIVVLLPQLRKISMKSRNVLWTIALIFLSSSFLFMIGKPVVHFFFVGIECCAIVLGAFLLSYLWKGKGKLAGMALLTVLVLFQIRLFSTQIKEKRAYVQVQQGVNLSQRMEVLDAVYARVGTTPFTVSIFGTPYGIRTAWSYYFWLYQQTHAVQIPSWYGFVANGYLGDTMMPHVDHPGSVHVTVYEPEFTLDPTLHSLFTNYQNEHTELLEQVEVNHHVIQIRKPIQEKAPTSKTR